MKLSCLLCCLCCFFAASSQTPNLPAAFTATFKSKGLDKNYQLTNFLKPPFIQADFNGDQNMDIAVFITEKKTKKKGILIIHGKTDEHFIFGAGRKFAESDNYQWADRWALYNKKTAYETQFDSKTGDIIGGKEVRLFRKGILVEAFEDGYAIAGEVIYWNSKKYISIHQGE